MVVVQIKMVITFDFVGLN